MWCKFDSMDASVISFLGVRAERNDSPSDCERRCSTFPKEIVPQDAAISLLLRSRKVTAIAQLPKVLLVEKAASGREVNFDRSLSDATLRLRAADAEAIAERTARGTKVLLQSPRNGTRFTSNFCVAGT